MRRPESRALEPLLVLSVLAAIVFGATVLRLEAEPTVRLPTFVLKSDGNVVGPVVATQGGEVQFTLLDPTFGNSIPMSLRISGNLFLEGSENWVFYTNNGCGGSAYVPEPATSLKPFSRMIGRTYAVGEDPGGSNLKLFRGTGTAGLQPPILSNWSNGTCADSTNVFVAALVPATEILDLTATMPPPYTIE